MLCRIHVLHDPYVSLTQNSENAILMATNMYFFQSAPHYSPHKYDL